MVHGTKSIMFKARLRYTAKLIFHVLQEFGYNPIKMLVSIWELPVYIYQLISFLIKSKGSVNIRLFPCLNDRHDFAGSISRHYFHQDLWAARKVYENKPENHIDVGSRIDGFISHLLTFRTVEVLDVRTMISPVKGMTFRQVNLMEFEKLPGSTCDSLSCLHALEHFGLGRYGDPIDPNGHVKGLKAITKMLKPGGTLLLSVPTGKERIEFNGHRIFSVSTILNLTTNDYDLVSFSYIDDANTLHENADPSFVPIMLYGCGLYELKKK
jgi:hypothetical protein